MKLLYPLIESHHRLEDMLYFYTRFFRGVSKIFDDLRTKTRKILELKHTTNKRWRRGFYAVWFSVRIARFAPKTWVHVQGIRIAPLSEHIQINPKARPSLSYLNGLIEKIPGRQDRIPLLRGNWNSTL